MADQWGEPFDMEVEYHPPAWYRAKAAQARETGDEKTAQLWESVVSRAAITQSEEKREAEREAEDE